MDFDFSEEQEAVAELARKILEDRATNEHLKDHEASGAPFDAALWGHIGHVTRNAARTVLLDLTGGKLGRSPVAGQTNRTATMSMRTAPGHSMPGPLTTTASACTSTGPTVRRRSTSRCVRAGSTTIVTRRSPRSSACSSAAASSPALAEAIDR